jgi:hypothetical protein
MDPQTRLCLLMDCAARRVPARFLTYRWTLVMLSGLQQRTFRFEVNMHPTSNDLAGHLADARRRIGSKQGNRLWQHVDLVGSAERVLALVTRKSVQGIDPHPVVGIVKQRNQVWEGLFVDEMIERLRAIHPDISVVVANTDADCVQRRIAAQQQVPIRVLCRRGSAKRSTQPLKSVVSGTRIPQ